MENKQSRKKTIMVKKPCKKVTYSDQSPQFFKIFLPDQCSKQLRIPPAFLKYFKLVWPSKSILRIPGKGSWPVDVNKVDDNLYFQIGWEEFVQENSLEFGDFLVFCYNGESTFYVSVYGRNRCRKGVFNTSKNYDKELVIHSQRNQTIELGRSKHVACLVGTEQLDTQYTVVPRAIQSKNPVFEIMIRPAYIKNGLLSIPQRFRRDIKEHREYAKLQHSSKAWLVKLVGDFDSRIQLSKGWKEFAEENSLCVGDVCSFELIDMERDMYVMNVSIHRASRKETARIVEYF